MHTRIIRTALVAGATAVATAVGGAGSALAAGTSHWDPATSGRATIVTRTQASVTGVRNPYYAGQGVDPAQGVTGISTTFYAPRINCVNPLAVDDFGAVLGGQQSFQGGAGLSVDCSTATPTYELSALVRNSPLTASSAVNPGDKLIVTVYATPRRRFAQVVDVTSGVTVNSGRNGTSTLIPFAVAGFIDDSGFAPKFGTVHFTYTQIDAEHLGQLRPTALVNQSPNTGQNLVVPIGTVAPYGQAFSIQYRHST